MKQEEQFILFTRDEFKEWLFKTQFTRIITIVQNHHTAQPNYASFNGNNHFIMLKSMKNFHVNNRGFNDIAQNLTTFPDGAIAICRPFDTIPAGIKGANTGALCIENVGNFDSDIMTEEHKKSIIFLNAMLCKRFNIPVSTDHIIYHHWYDLTTGQRTNGTGSVKTCPGTKFFGGNNVETANKVFIPLVREALTVNFDEALDVLVNKVGIDKTYWSGKKDIDPYFSALMIKIATKMKG